MNRSLRCAPDSGCMMLGFQPSASSGVHGLALAWQQRRLPRQVTACCTIYRSRPREEGIWEFEDARCMRPPPGAVMHNDTTLGVVAG